MTKFLMSILIICNLKSLPLIAQLGGLDSAIVVKDAKIAAQKIEEIKEWIFDSINVAYKRDSTIFNDPSGKKSIGKILTYVASLTVPYRQKIYTPIAKRILNKDEFKFFGKMKFKSEQKSGVPIIAFENTIDYDLKWISNFFVITYLIITPDWSDFEIMYYLTSYDISGVQVPIYLEKMLKPDDIRKAFTNQVVNFGFDFFILMHEFYHAYYENRLHLIIHDEIKADEYALKKLEVFTESDEMDGLINDSIFFQLLKAAGSYDEFMSMKNIYTTCVGKKRYLNDGITMREFSSAFLGTTLIEFFLKGYMRSLLTDGETIKINVARAEALSVRALRTFKCKDNDESGFCCSVNNFQYKIRKMRDLAESLEAYNPYNQKVDTVEYKALNSVVPEIIPFCLGNYSLAIGEYEKAISFYQSSNLLHQKSEITVLCNLYCYEIYLNVITLKDLKLATKFLNNAKLLNKQYPTVRDEIINSLQVQE